VAILDHRRVTVRELEHDLGSSITRSFWNTVGHVSTSVGPSLGFTVNVRRFSVTSHCFYCAGGFCCPGSYVVGVFCRWHSWYKYLCSWLLLLYVFHFVLVLTFLYRAAWWWCWY
jgi:hypothetical protein